MSTGYVPIRVKDFVSGSVASVDIYVCIDGIKYLKILHKGQAFEPDRLTRYQDKNVELLYLKAEDFSGYVKETTKIGAMLAQKSNVDPIKIAMYLNRASEVVVSELFATNISAETIEHVRAINAQFLSSLQKRPRLAEILASLEDIGDEFSRHCIGVSMVSTMLAIALNMTNSKTVEIVQMGGFLHDIGFRELPRELALKPRALMTPDEVRLYESHPVRGVQLLESLPTVPSEVLKVIDDHHEHASGTGFPRGVKHDRVYHLARLVSLADMYCHQTLSSSVNTAPRSGPDTVNHLQEVYGRDFPNEFWAALNRLVGRATD